MGIWEVVKTVAPMIGNAFMGIGKMILGVLIPNPSMIKEGWTQLSGAFQDAGAKVSASFNKGYTSGLGDIASKTTAKSGKTNSANAVSKTTVSDISPKGATANKAVTINISIGKMIENFKINTTNLTESTSKVHEAVSNVLLQAINDSQIVGNI